MDHTSFAKKLGANLRKARWLKGWTQEDVAAQGVTLRYYQEMERRERNPTLRLLLELADILGVTVADLASVPGARPSDPPLSARKAQPPPRGRKPKKPRH